MEEVPRTIGTALRNHLDQPAALVWSHREVHASLATIAQLGEGAILSVEHVLLGQVVLE